MDRQELLFDWMENVNEQTLAEKCHEFFSKADIAVVMMFADFLEPELDNLEDQIEDERRAKHVQ